MGTDELNTGAGVEGGGNTVLYSWARHLTCTVLFPPRSTNGY